MNRSRRHDRLQGEPAAIEPATAGRVGSFRFYTAERRWEWSAEVARMHGYEPDDVVPTTALIMSHKHPDDAPSVAAVIEQVVEHGRPFSSRHRIIDTAGEVHVVVVVGDLLLDDRGATIGTGGFYVDITEDYDLDVRGAVDDVVADLAASRAVIEQAKMILMLAYSIAPERAFDILSWRSQQTNTKVRDLAGQFVRDVLERTRIGQGFPRQIDHLLLTAHARIGEPENRPRANSGRRPRIADLGVN